MWAGIIQSTKGLSRTKTWRRVNLLLLSELRYLLLLDIDCSGSWTLRRRLNYTSNFLGSPAYRQQILGHLCFHNWVSQFSNKSPLITNYLSVIPYLLFIWPILLVLFLWRTLMQLLMPSANKHSLRKKRGLKNIIRLFKFHGIWKHTS